MLKDWFGGVDPIHHLDSTAFTFRHLDDAWDLIFGRRERGLMDLIDKKTQLECDLEMLGRLAGEEVAKGYMKPALALERVVKHIRNQKAMIDHPLKTVQSNLPSVNWNYPPPPPERFPSFTVSTDHTEVKQGWPTRVWLKKKLAGMEHEQEYLVSWRSPTVKGLGD